MPRALKPGKERGATLCIGSKAPIVVGSLLSWVIVPFIKLEEPYTELKELIRNIWDWWDDKRKAFPILIVLEFAFWLKIA